MLRYVFGVLILLAGCATQAPQGPALHPTAHADFHHDTLALTWQPGFCAVGSGCLPDQPRIPLIGLHGLWASEPGTLEARNIPVQAWWRDGCSLLEQEQDVTPILDAPLQNQLATIVPHTTHPLVPHEFNKHARCFGYQPGPFFATAAALRLKFAQSAIGAWLSARAGTMVSHAAMLSFFDQATGNVTPRALQLQCSRDHQGHVVLTQMWFTLRPDRLDVFPKAAAYIASPEPQDNCPAQFLLRRW
ncbi:ribonuclease I [Neoasaia chiangmaiensis NBRC 101099]|uniref:Ribonuclease I n=1 Tax=Neoasaia chiangmaiensis TaxID=320497 RepID=A0A1U9KN66_9PROT|nr:ribonuclease I [Neoasaia chiangmaiensis]AQS87236.1 ribonuclease I [Neoasaia chiangmaiensis]GBR38411.1 ribonuclease I [Neoasaia chiangmaiensis NBRC 101099]GEN15906.1 ribonuclease [Neoasaia chiangmaiensis]